MNYKLIIFTLFWSWSLVVPIYTKVHKLKLGTESFAVIFSEKSGNFFINLRQVANLWTNSFWIFYFWWRWIMNFNGSIHNSHDDESRRKKWLEREIVFCFVYSTCGGWCVWLRFHYPSHAIMACVKKYILRDHYTSSKMVEEVKSRPQNRMHRNQLSVSLFVPSFHFRRVKTWGPQ